MELSATNKSAYNAPKPLSTSDIVTLNVGGEKFCTSQQTLTWIPDSFFSSLLSGRIPSVRDETGALFIDRDPVIFRQILNFLRTRTVDIKNADLWALKHDAEYFGIHPLVKRLTVCEEMETSSCGSILFHAQLHPPVFDSLPDLESRPHFPPLRPDLQRQVIQIAGHMNCIAVAYHHCVCMLSAHSRGWELVFTTPPLEKSPQRIALNGRVTATALGDKLLAVVLGYEIKIWSCSPASKLLASFDMRIPVDGLFFCNNQLVAISNTGKVAVWQGVQRHWQVQELSPISSYTMAGLYLLIGCDNGCIYYIDMEKFPVRMKDNDLLVTQLFEDPFKEAITALSVFMPPTCWSDQTWMEVAYGTRGGGVRVIVRHPENIGQAPQLFQSYNIHSCAVSQVVLGEKNLVSVCSENHVRSWTVTRFRGRISTQPGSTPIASFKVLSLEGAHSLYNHINSIGPFGEADDERVFVQRVIPDIDKIYVRLSSTGDRVCEIESVDNSNISTYCVHECEGVSRVGMRSRRFIFTGHVNGSVQVWDLTTALEIFHKISPAERKTGPSKEEVLRLLHNCELTSSSLAGSNVSSRAPSPSPSLMSIMCPGYRPAPSSTNQSSGTPISTPILPHSTSDHLQVPDSGLVNFQATRSSGIFTTSSFSLQAQEEQGDREDNQSDPVVVPDIPVPSSEEQTVKPRVNLRRSCSPRGNTPAFTRVPSDCSTTTTSFSVRHTRTFTPPPTSETGSLTRSLSGHHIRARSLGSESCASDRTITPHDGDRPVSSLSADLLQSSSLERED